MWFHLTQFEPGHSSRIHALVSMETPAWQGLPPFAGAGFVQPRVRFWEPLSHVFEQEDHLDQADQLPFTIKMDKERLMR